MGIATLPGFLGDGLRLLLFGGKGGVGKTTCAAATGISLARSNPAGNFLLVSTDPAHSLVDCFAGGSPIQNLVLREINPQESLARFKARHEDHLRTIALRGTFLDQADVTNFLDLSMPGLDEVMALLEISTWVKEERYSCILVDTAPAGHTLRLLGLPVAMRQWLGTLDAMLAKHRYIVRLYRGAYRKDATDLYLEEMAAEIETLGALLRAPGLCRFVPVLLAERLSIEITGMMVAELVQLQLPVREVVVNRLTPAQPDCPVCVALAATQATVVADLRRTFSQYALWGLPFFLEEIQGTGWAATAWEYARPLPSPSPLPTGERTKERGNSANALAPAVEHPAPLPSSSMKLLLVAGKGGVGKTTLACASALRLAEQWSGKEILLFSLDPAHSLSACLGCEIGPQTVRVARRLTAIELDAQAEYARLKRDYADELAGVFDHFNRPTGIDIAFDREVMERIMDLAPPGLDEILALTRIVEFLDQGRYDLFILDSAPTGHFLRFLEMPSLIEDWLRTFFGLFLKYREVFRLPKLSQEMVALSKRVKHFRRVLTDPGQAALVAVAIPTEMAYEETRDLVAACERLGVSVPVLFVNMVTPASSAPPTPTCPTCTALRHEEESVLHQYEETFADQHLTIVSRQGSPQGLQQLSALGSQLYRRRGRPHEQRLTEGQLLMKGERNGAC